MRAELGKGQKGPNINSSALRAAGKTRSGAGRQSWLGVPSACRKGGIDYRYVSPDPYGAKYFKGAGQIAAPAIEVPTREPRPRAEVTDLITPKTRPL